MTDTLDFSDAALAASGGPGLDTIGRVEEIADGIAFCSGLLGARINDVVVIDERHTGLVLVLDEEAVGIGIMESEADVSESMPVRLVGPLDALVSTTVGGRVFSPSGEPLDGLLPPTDATRRRVFGIAPPLSTIRGVFRPLETGITLIDTITPIGLGQRQLIVGDRSTGKTQIVMDIVVNQRGRNVHCVYVAIGKKTSEIAALIAQLKERDAFEHTTVVMTSADASLTEQYVAPYYGMALAEGLRDAGRDVLVVLDDLVVHADAYRSLSLLLRRIPGREAYPGDIFYIHGSLLERAAQRTEAVGGGSITALPLVSSLSGDITGYIPSNVMSITDGQLVLSPQLANEGQFPAIDVGISVSRVGSDAQYPVVSRMSRDFRRVLAEYAELKPTLLFDNDLSREQEELLDAATVLLHVLRQAPWQPVPLGQMVALLQATAMGVFSRRSPSEIAALKQAITAGVAADPRSLDFEDSLRRTRHVADSDRAWVEAVIVGAQTALAAKDEARP